MQSHFPCHKAARRESRAVFTKLARNKGCARKGSKIQYISLSGCCLSEKVIARALIKSTLRLNLGSMVRKRRRTSSPRRKWLVYLLNQLLVFWGLEMDGRASCASSAINQQKFSPPRLIKPHFRSSAASLCARSRKNQSRPDCYSWGGEQGVGGDDRPGVYN